MIICCVCRFNGQAVTFSQQMMPLPQPLQPQVCQCSHGRAKLMRNMCGVSSRLDHTVNASMRSVGLQFQIFKIGWASQWLIWGRIQAWFHYCIPHFSCRLETVLSVCVYDWCTMLCFRLWYLLMDSLSTWSWMTVVTSPIWFMRNTHNISRVSKVSREIKRTCIHKKLSVIIIKCCYFAVANTPN